MLHTESMDATYQPILEDKYTLKLLITLSLRDGIDLGMKKTAL